MALDDPYAPVTPWGWIPPEWLQPEPAPAPVDVTPQIAAPAPTPQEMPQPQLPPPPVTAEIEMPPEYVGKQAELEMPPEYVGQGAQLPFPQVASFVGDAQTLPPMPDAPVEQTAPPESSPYFDSMDASTWANPAGASDLYTMAKRDPVGYAQHIGAMQDVRAGEERRLTDDATAEHVRKTEQDQRDLMDVLRQGEEKRKALLETEIDPGRFMKSRSIPQSIAAFVSVIVGGLYQARKGGSNIGLDILDKAIDQDIAAQQANLANKRAGINDERAAAMSNFEVQQAIRIGAYKQALGQVQSKMQDFDPAGTTAARLAQQALEIEGRIAQAAEGARRNFVDEQLKLRKDQREMMETQAKLRDADAKYAAQLAKMGGGTKPEDVPQPVEYFKAMYPNAPAPPRPMTEKEYRSWIGTTKAGAEASQALGAETPEETRRRELGIGGPDGEPLINKDGKPFIARDKTIGEKLTKQANAAREVADIIDEVLAIRERSGGESKLFNSDDRMRLDALQNQLIILQKSGTEGMSSDEDMKKLADAVGAGDVASFRSRSAGLEKGRERTIGFLNQTLKSNQYTGKPVTVPNRFKLPKPKATVTEEITSRAMQSPYIKGDPSSPIDVAAVSTPAQQKLNSSYETDIKTLAANAEARDEKTKEAARASLEKLAKEHPTEEGRALAAEALKNVPGASPVRER